MGEGRGKEGEVRRERERGSKRGKGRTKPLTTPLCQTKPFRGDFVSFNMLPPLIVTLFFFSLQIKTWHAFEVLTASKTCSH